MKYLLIFISLFLLNGCLGANFMGAKKLLREELSLNDGILIQNIIRKIFQKERHFMGQVQIK